MKEPSEAIRRWERSGIRQMFDLANTIPDAIHLEMGEPDFATPDHVVEAAARAAGNGHTKYTPNAGIADLREALADKVARRNGLDSSPERILVTPGAIAALYASFLVTCDPGDQILIPDPAWPNYRMIAGLQDLEAVRYPVRVEDGLVPVPELIEPLVTERTKVLLLNSPSNPTGAVASPDDLARLLELAERHDLWVVSDEVYDEMCFRTDVAPSAARFGDPSRVVTVYSFSKTYAMTGWRVGYAVTPPALTDLMVKTQEPITACVNAPAQMGALAAVTGTQACVAEMRLAYRDRRDDSVAALTAAGIPHLVPSGAFYLWVDISGSGSGSEAFARRLLLEEGVAVTPGIAFGPDSDGFVRVSLATEPSLLREGVSRIARALEAP
jgi:aspartate aminotransferase